MDHPHMSKVGVQDAKPPEARGVLRHIQCKIPSKFVVFEHTLLTKFHPEEKNGGYKYMDRPPCQKVEGIPPYPGISAPEV